MSYLTAFIVSFGSFLALLAVISGWLFRTSSAPFAMKLIIPALLVGVACGAPFSILEMLGFPVPSTMAALPDHVKLIAFVTQDDERTVDLWLSRDGRPRAYEVTLDSELKKTLREAAREMGQGKPVFLHKQPKKGPAGDAKMSGSKNGVTEIHDDYVSGYTLDDTSGLPPK